MKKTSLLVLLTILISIACIAQADGTWICPKDSTTNNGNFCSHCGLSRTDAAVMSGKWICPNDASENDGNFCPVCGMKRETATATATPAPKRTFSIDQKVTASKSMVQISWVDSANAGPYQVYFYFDDNLNENGYWGGKGESGSTTTKKNFSISGMIPGEKYLVVVEDSKGETAVRSITAPSAKSFVDGGLTQEKISLAIIKQYKTSTNLDNHYAKDCKFSSDAMAKNLNNGYVYGLYFEMDYPKLAKARTYDTLIVFEAPNGFIETEHYSSITYGTEYAGLYISFVGEDFFNDLYKTCGSIPKGEYVVKLYWDGMFVKSTTFKVE